VRIAFPKLNLGENPKANERNDVKKRLLCEA